MEERRYLGDFSCARNDDRGRQSFRVCQSAWGKIGSPAGMDEAPKKVFIDKTTETDRDVECGDPYGCGVFNLCQGSLERYTSEDS